MAQGNITKKQLEILEYIKAQILQRGFPPSVREICDGVQLKSTSSVHSHLEALEQNGYIKRDPTKPRAIEILDEMFHLNRREVINVPLIRNLAIGQPILSQENIENYFPIPLDFIRNKQAYMIRVKGDSMKNACIMEGDYVLVEHTQSAMDGDIVVTMLENQMTIRRLYHDEEFIRFEAENDFMNPVLLPMEETHVLGKVLGVYRMYV
jgi:repressor LexA